MLFVAAQHFRLYIVYGIYDMWRFLRLTVLKCVKVVLWNGRENRMGLNCGRPTCLKGCSATEWEWVCEVFLLQWTKLCYVETSGYTFISFRI